jgi:hypothetical protein
MSVLRDLLNADARVTMEKESPRRATEAEAPRADE